jgi:hypothetical protein
MFDLRRNRKMNKETTLSICTIAIVLGLGVSIIPTEQSSNLSAGVSFNSDVYGEVTSLSEAKQLMGNKMISLPSDENLKLVVIDEKNSEFVTLIYDDGVSSKMSVSSFPDATLVIESAQHKVNPLLGLQTPIPPMIVTSGGKVIDTIPQGPSHYVEVKVGDNSGVFIEGEGDNTINLIVWWDADTNMLHKISSDKNQSELSRVAVSTLNS